MCPRELRTVSSWDRLVIEILSGANASLSAFFVFLDTDFLALQVQGYFLLHLELKRMTVVLIWYCLVVEYH